MSAREAASALALWLAPLGDVPALVKTLEDLASYDQALAELKAAHASASKVFEQIKQDADDAKLEMAAAREAAVKNQEAIQAACEAAKRLASDQIAADRLAAGKRLAVLQTRREEEAAKLKELEDEVGSRKAVLAALEAKLQVVKLQAATIAQQE